MSFLLVNIKLGLNLKIKAGRKLRGKIVHPNESVDSLTSSL